ncbi:uncharacterized protein KGF55_003911 [Candida pseudojiufengensis]|uniref:uncharacterized protein n=1 Tax=Candida pseudojiufengensis TaxID=497109 RepID=UPI002224333B|nr:uncharacterized protein KGF55_003911 [Candida pseudojiufengensis]KAI5961594.1 hypothetical protein KGF55_003911 [Candida pseudojiufengensis]
MPTNTHEDAVAANISTFDEEFASKYEKRESQILLSYLFAKNVLEFDPNKSRKSDEESSKLIGDPSQYCNGLTKENTLPNPLTYEKDFPNGLFKPGMKLLDFACGTGMVTELFIPYLKQPGQKSEIVGIDIGPVFLKYFNERAKKYSDENLEMKSYEYDILNPKLEKKVSKFENQFDVIICTISYHHIHNYEIVTQKLASFLKKGGWLFIIDFYNEDVEKIDLSNTNSKNMKVSEAVQHMGGLKKSSLNHVLKNLSGLINVTSSREFKTFIWQPASFIENHSDEQTVNNLKTGKLKQKDFNDEINYLIETSVIYAIGQKP